MDDGQLMEELKAMLVSRLRFDPGRVAGLCLETPLPKGVEGSLGLDSLDFIELALAVEERYGIPMDETQDLASHFASVGSLCRLIAEGAGQA